MNDRRAAYARVYVVAWLVWAGTWVFALIRAGETRIVVDSAVEYWGLGILFASCMTLGISASAARLSAGSIRARTPLIGAWAAMLGAMIPCAWKLIKGDAEPSLHRMDIT